MDIKISASILSANPMELGKAIKDVEIANVDFAHIDVMDGHFVPNITMGPFIVEGIKKISNIPLDIHLMIENPDKYIEAFAKASREGDIITFHIETTDDPQKIISMIKNCGLKAGIALNPATPAKSIESVVGLADLILVMTVNPGFSGQSFMKNVMPKLKEISKMIQDKTYLAVDGGITVETAPIAVKNGANVLTAASAIFKYLDTFDAVKKLKDSVQSELKMAV